jgi:subtilisin family serine protease
MSFMQGVLGRALSVSVEALSKHELAPVTVAILDSGVDGSHPDLAGRVIQSRIFAANDEGKVEFRESDPNTNNDLYGHGTAVASIIGRIAPNTSFIDYRVLGGDNRGSGEVLVYSFARAVNSDAKLLNMSLAASEKYAPRMNDICERAYRRGVVIVAARRNMPLQDEGYPAALNPCIGVDNAGSSEELAWLYRNKVIEYAAYGEDVPAAAPGGGYTTVSGTSFATPIMCGFVALLLGANPELRPFEVKAVLKAMAKQEEEKKPR